MNNETWWKVVGAIVVGNVLTAILGALLFWISTTDFQSTTFVAGNGVLAPDEVMDQETLEPEVVCTQDNCSANAAE